MDVEYAYAGDIAAFVGLKKHSHWRYALRRRTLLSAWNLPRSRIQCWRWLLSLRLGFDRDKLSVGLQRLAEEDPTFRVFTNGRYWAIDYRRNG